MSRDIHGLAPQNPWSKTIQRFGFIEVMYIQGFGVRVQGFEFHVGGLGSGSRLQEL